MSNERRTVLEHVSSAMAGEDSRDWLAALGMAQAAPGRLNAGESRALGGIVDQGIGGLAAVATIGSQLTRLQQASSQVLYNQARDSIAALVRHLNQVLRWVLMDDQVRIVAESSLLLHMHPTCTHCNGRGLELIDGTPHLSEQPCKPCHGSGQRQLPRRHRDQVAHVLNVLTLIQGITERAVARRIR